MRFEAGNCFYRDTGVFTVFGACDEVAVENCGLICWVLVFMRKIFDCSLFSFFFCSSFFLFFFPSFPRAGDATPDGPSRPRGAPCDPNVICLGRNSIVLSMDGTATFQKTYPSEYPCPRRPDPTTGALFGACAKSQIAHKRRVGGDGDLFK